jgi:hypothetical protein
MSDSKNNSLQKADKLLVELNSNALLFATNGKRIYNLVVSAQDLTRIKGRIYFEYLHRKFECDLVLQANQISLTALSPSLLTPAGLFKVEAASLAVDTYLNDLGIITQKGDETIGWLILDIINHFNACRLKPRNSNQFRSQLN